MFAVGYFSMSMHWPTETLCKAVKNGLNFLARTKILVVTYAMQKKSYCCFQRWWMSRGACITRVDSNIYLFWEAQSSRVSSSMWKLKSRSKSNIILFCQWWTDLLSEILEFYCQDMVIFQYNYWRRQLRMYSITGKGCRKWSLKTHR